MNYNRLSRRMLDKYHREGKDTYFPIKPQTIDMLKLSEQIRKRAPVMGLFVTGKGFTLKQVTPYKVKV